MSIGGRGMGEDRRLWEGRIHRRPRRARCAIRTGLTGWTGLGTLSVRFILS